MNQTILGSGVVIGVVLSLVWVSFWVEAIWGQILSWRIDRHPERFTWVWCPPIEGDLGCYMVQTRLDRLKARLFHESLWPGWRNWLTYHSEEYRPEWVNFDPEGRLSLAGEREYRAWFVEITGGKCA
jgi:hypothetical protein